MHAAEVLSWVSYSTSIVAIIAMASCGRIILTTLTVIFACTSAAWLWTHNEVVEFGSVITGSALLCSLVVLTSGTHRYWPSIKMIAGALTQGSSCSYNIFHIPWGSIEYTPTDASIVAAVVAVCSIFSLRWRHGRQFRGIVVTIIYLLLAGATLALRVGAPPVCYVLLTWTAILSSCFRNKKEDLDSQKANRTTEAKAAVSNRTRQHLGDQQT